MEYLAYGSNMLSARLAGRVPSARDACTVRLPGYEVRYRKRGRDGSAKCDLVRVAGGAATAWGVVSTIDAGDRWRLDLAEGAGAGYHAETLTVRCSGRDVNVFTYIADEAAVDPRLLPFDWYRDLVVAGALEHGLPSDYVGRLRDVPVVADRDTSRRDRERSALTQTT